MVSFKKKNNTLQLVNCSLENYMMYNQTSEINGSVLELIVLKFIGKYWKTGFIMMENKLKLFTKCQEMIGGIES